jgi:hypothetical protein
LFEIVNAKTHLIVAGAVRTKRSTCLKISKSHTQLEIISSRLETTKSTDAAYISITFSATKLIITSTN